jgi:hypothetical protein
MPAMAISASSSSPGSGVPLLLGTVLVVALLGRRLLPERKSAHLPEDFGQHARTLTEQYAVSGSARLYRVGDGSPLLGKSREAFESGSDVSLIAVSGVAPDKAESKTFAAGDVLVLRGSPEALARFAETNRLEPCPTPKARLPTCCSTGIQALPKSSSSRARNSSARCCRPAPSPRAGSLSWWRSSATAKTLAAAGKEVAALRRVTLQAGDHLLLQGTWRALDRIASDPDVLAVDSPDQVRRQAVPLGPGSTVMLAILAAMVLVLATGILPASRGRAARGDGRDRLRNPHRAAGLSRHRLEHGGHLVASMLPLSTAMYRTGVATEMADLLVAAIGESNPTMLLAGLFLFTAILGQVISNTATAMIVIPIAVTAAGELGISALPVLMSLNVGASAAFLTPVATTSNLIVMGPGGYRFGDYWKLGIVLMAFISSLPFSGCLSYGNL